MYNQAIESMLAKYKIIDSASKTLALREIIQEIALLGLWRGKFFEHAAFYGGTALRILYGLNRYSEDLDFSLLKTDMHFSLKDYCSFIEKELLAFGFKATVSVKNKTIETQIESAFLKTDSEKEILSVQKGYYKNEDMPLIKIKIEVDKDPPLMFGTEEKFLLNPIPFSVKAFDISSLMAGKLHAVLCRQWSTRVKGRDWYDLQWYISRGVAVNIKHLEQRLIQTGHWKARKNLSLVDLKNMLTEKIGNTDFEQAKVDIERFIDTKELINMWSKEFFIQITEKLEIKNEL